MSVPQYELVIFGSTPLAQMLAGLLASVHGKRVVLVAETPSPLRLLPGLDLSVMPITRPESWALIKAGTAETLRLLAQLRAAEAIRRVDPLFIAETEASIDALSHMRRMATGFGWAVERATDRSLAGATGFRYRDAVLLDRAALDPALSAWLARIGVLRLEARRTKAVFRRDGSSRLEQLEQTVEAAHAVLADDEAILARQEAVAPVLSAMDATIMLLTSSRRPAAPVLVDLDRGVTLIEQHDRQLLALGRGRPVEAASRVAAALAAHGPLRRLGQRQRTDMATVDGAPSIGSLPGGKTTILAGLGMSGAFLAPALARYLAGLSAGHEHAYFAAREPSRSPRTAIADYAPPEGWS